MKLKLFLIFILMLTVSVVSGEKISVLSDLINPGMVLTDGKMFYAVDGENVKFYDLGTGKFLGKFGSKGEGPGQLIATQDAPLSLQILKDKLMLYSFNKIIYYSKSGKILNEQRLSISVLQLVKIGEHFAATKIRRNNSGQAIISLVLYDKSFKPIKKIYESLTPNNVFKKEIIYPMLDIYMQVIDEELFVFDMQKDFTILVFDKYGKKKNSISKNYKKIKVDAEYEKKTKQALKLLKIPQRILKMFKFQKNLPVMRHFMIADKKIYVRTFLDKKDTSEFFILSLSGKTLKRKFLPTIDEIELISPTPSSKYAFWNNYYYHLVETDDDQWELHKEEILKN